MKIVETIIKTPLSNKDILNKIQKKNGFFQRYNKFYEIDNHTYEMSVNQRGHYQDKIYLKLNHNKTDNIPNVINVKIKMIESKLITVIITLVFSLAAVVTYISFDGWYFVTFLLPAIFLIIESLFYQKIIDNWTLNQIEYLTTLFDGESEKVTIED